MPSGENSRFCRGQARRTAFSDAEYFGDPGQQLFYSPPGAGVAVFGNQLSDARRRSEVSAEWGGIWRVGAARPHVGASAHGTGGKREIMIRGNERELLRLNLKGETFSWALWVDEKDQFKLMRVLVADDNTEV